MRLSVLQVPSEPDTAFKHRGETASEPPRSSSYPYPELPCAMSGGGDVRVLRQEAGQESPRMPAWKREILERRKAKGGGSVGTAAAPETGPGGQLNGELTGNVNGGGDGAVGGSGRNYTISAASQHFNKEPRPSERTAPREESLVLQESLGPLEENPFIKLEKERRRRQDRENAARPVQHILELYGSVPGIRTIRAENIIIIESDPDYFPEPGAGKAGASWQQNGVDSYSSLNELLDRRGSSVTEIRAKEVVIYDTTLSKSEENLSTLGRPDQDAPHDPSQGQGRVSRILQKFDSNYGKLQKKSHSTENLLDLDCSASSRPRLWPKPQPDLVPKPRPVQPTSPVFQRPWSSKPKPAVSEPEGPRSHPGAHQSVSSYRHRFQDQGVNGAAPVSRDDPDRVQSKPPRERDREESEVSPKPKVPCSPETRSAESSLLPVSSRVLKSSPEFEIRPSVKPDLDQIPDGDSQARALANLRLQSRNSFTVVPKRRLQTPSAPPDPIGGSPSRRAAGGSMSGVPTPPAPTDPPVTTKRKEEKEPEPPPPPPASDPSPPSPAPPTSPVLISPPSSPGPPVDHLPVTNIDDIEVDPPQRVPAPSPMLQKKKGNTFTVVPKRLAEPQKSPAPIVTAACADPSVETPPASTPPPAPFAQLGSQLKKRYPAVEEIQVIGGYQALEKSCLSKTGSLGKKVRPPTPEGGPQKPALGFHQVWTLYFRAFRWSERFALQVLLVFPSGAELNGFLLGGHILQIKALRVQKFKMAAIFNQSKLKFSVKVAENDLY